MHRHRAGGQYIHSLSEDYSYMPVLRLIALPSYTLTPFMVSSWRRNASTVSLVSRVPAGRDLFNFFSRTRADTAIVDTPLSPY